MSAGRILLRSTEKEDTTPETAVILGKALAMDHKTVVVARDLMRSSSVMAEAVISGLLAQGANVIDIGIVSAPAAAMFASRGDCAVYVAGTPGMISGFYLLNRDGSMFSDVQIRHLDMIFDNPPEAPDHTHVGRRTFRTGITEEYNRGLEKHCSRDVKCSVVLDCRCGITADSVPQILNFSGADVLTINCQRDPEFRSFESKDRGKEIRNVEDIVAASPGSIGIRMNGIGTIAEFIDEKGILLRQDIVFALLLMYLKPRKVAITMSTSSLVADAFHGRLESDMISPYPDREGDKELIFTDDNAAAICSAVADGADIGFYHGSIVFNGQAVLGDGIRAAIAVVQMAGDNNLHQLSESLPEYLHQSKSYKWNKKAEMFRKSMEENLEELGDRTTRYGNAYRIVMEHGWFIVSHHTLNEEYTIHVSAESRDKLYLIGMMEVADKLVKEVMKFE